MNYSQKLKGYITLKKEEVYGHIDHTLLKAFSTTEQIEAIAEEALKYGTASICIPTSFVNYIHNKYKDVNICTVIGFPLGYSTTPIKVAEAKQAIEDGANEIDMVINIGWAKEHIQHLCIELLVGLLVAQQFLYGLKQHGKFTAIDHGAVRQSVR